MSVHKAQYSKEIVAEIRSILLERYPDFWARPKIWDPFAGPGQRLALIAGAEFDYGGTEIEESFIVNPNIRQGNACDPNTYPAKSWVACTSPAYPNGVADHANMNDDSVRNNYRAWIKQIEGADRELDPENMGRWGYRGTKRDGRSLRRQTFWDIAERAVANWDKAELAIVNVSDFISNKEVEPFVSDWVQMMHRMGWQIQESRRVETQRLGQGENFDARVPYEYVLVFGHGES